MALPPKRAASDALAGPRVGSTRILSRLPVSDWHVCLEALREARRSCPGWPAEWDESVARLVIATLRFSRPDGSPAGDFDGAGSFAPPEKCFAAWLRSAARHGNCPVLAELAAISEGAT